MQRPFKFLKTHLKNVSNDFEIKNDAENNYRAFST
jgi:hypothetical protein